MLRWTVKGRSVFNRETGITEWNSSYSILYEVVIECYQLPDDHKADLYAKFAEGIIRTNLLICGRRIEFCINYFLEGTILCFYA